MNVCKSLQICTSPNESKQIHTIPYESLRNRRILTSHYELLRNHECSRIFTNPYTHGNHHFDTLSMLSLGIP